MNEFIYLFLGILVIAYIFLITFALITGLSTFKTGGAMFATTHNSKIEKVLEAVAMLPGQVVYDLGCGDGRFLIAAVKKYNVKAAGFEINPWAYVLSKLKVKLLTTKVSIHFKDFWKADLSSADFIFCYLFPDVMERLKEKLSRELKAGAKVISCNFEIPGWIPEKIITPSHPVHNDPIFIYTRK
ncbi:MAG TPA: class I SAM-dependent methyltransferase [Thermodesulfovibrionales bacterium]|nr:class I SAM-dependent methyltransferase [Thermodesulfovibrionales bacterium]